MNWDVMTLIGVVIIALVIAAAFSGVFTRFARGKITVYEHEAGLRYKKGRLVDVVGPGLYATWPAPVEITRLDLREASTPISGQEILTADQLSLRVSVVVAYRIADPRAYASSAAMPITQLYHIVQTELRERVAARKLDEVLADRGGLVAGMAEAVQAEAAALGYKVSSVKLLDLTIAGPAKQAYADLWKAQKEGLAALERARGEQSALRALANAARHAEGESGTHEPARAANLGRCSRQNPADRRPRRRQRPPAGRFGAGQQRRGRRVRVAAPAGRRLASGSNTRAQGAQGPRASTHAS